MNGYNYLEAMKNDILNWLRDEPQAMQEHADDLEEWLNDELWVEDSVTGNGSGSYTFNWAQARDYVRDNMELLVEAKEEFGVTDESFGRWFKDGEWEAMDVTIRCYLLGEAIHEALKEVETDDE